MNNTPVFDIEAIRARLGASDVPVAVCTAYLQVLTNLNALSVLVGPSFAFEDEQGDAKLNRLLQNHLRHKRQLEFDYPLLASVGRPKGWKGN